MKRKERISSLLQQEVSSILRKKINDDRIGFISITSVTVSDDLAHAWIYYSQIGSKEEKEKTKRGLASATKFIHADLSRNIRYMAVPKIHFKFDESLEKGVSLVEKINNL